MTRRWIAITVVAAASTLLIGRAIAGAYVEYQWFQSLGAGAVWRVRTLDMVLMRAFCALIAGAFAFVNLVAVSNSVASIVLPRRVANLEIGERVPGQRLIAAAAAAAVLLGLLLALPLDDWATFDRARMLPYFGEQEAYDKRDLSFYVYWLPFENALYTWALLVLFAVTGAVLALYALSSSLRWERGRVRITGYVRRHLAVLGAVLLLLLSWGHRLDAYALLLAGGGPQGEFTFVDQAVTQPARLALAIFTAGAALLVLRGGWMGQTRLAFGAVTAVLAATLLLHGIVPWVARGSWEPPDKQTRVREFAAVRALVTQRAYAVGRVDTLPRPGDFGSLGELSRGIPIWDAPALAQALERGRRTGAVVGEFGWQIQAGRLIAVAAERAGAPGGPDADPSAPWRTLRIAATVSDDRGGPVLVDAAGAPESAEAAREIAVVVHPGAEGSLIVADTTGRVAGNPVGTVSSRLAAAWSQRDLRLLFSERLPPAAPEIVRRRDVRERVAALVPYFAQGSAVAAVSLGDSLYWTLELYSTSASYPLSQRYAIVGAEHTYFQHAATAVVSAQTGSVLLVRVDDPDPIARGWYARFESLFTARAAVRADLLAALPPATDGALAQAQVFAQFGQRNDAQFRPREFPRSDGGDSTLVDGAPALMALARRGADPVLAWTVPLLERSTLRVAGLVVALGGREPRVLWQPSVPTAPRWTEVGERLARGSDSGSLRRSESDRPLVNGRVRAFPTATGFAYAQPFYSVRGDNVPAFSFVALLAGDSLTAGESVPAAAGALLADSGIALTGDFRTRVDALHAAMRAALRRGDWAAFGAAFDALGALLGRARE